MALSALVRPPCKIDYDATLFFNRQTSWRTTPSVCGRRKPAFLTPDSYDITHVEALFSSITPLVVFVDALR